MSISQGLQANFPFDTDLPAPRCDVPRLTGWAPGDWPVADDWRPLVDEFLRSASGQNLGQFIRARLAAGAIIYPAQPLKALAMTPLAQVKVVILGQDPYHGPGQAEGLAFSVAPGVKPPPSLRNIFKEAARDSLARDGVVSVPRDGSLARWANQGVLLLNTCLTVEDGKPASHARRGWEQLTDQVVKAVAARESPVVYMLWGAHAQAKQGLVAAHGANGAQLVLMANHPSPLSALRSPKPFVGCQHFSLANDFLTRHGQQPIDWQDG